MELSRGRLAIIRLPSTSNVTFAIADFVIWVVRNELIVPGVGRTNPPASCGQQASFFLLVIRSLASRVSAETSLRFQGTRSRLTDGGGAGSAEEAGEAQSGQPPQGISQGRAAALPTEEGSESES